MPVCDDTPVRAETVEEALVRIGERAEALRVPLRGLLELTYRCPHRCVHCYCTEEGRPLAMYAGRKELSADDWRRALDGLAEAGCLELTLTGGEPLSHPGWAEVAAHAVADRFAVTLFTGGTRIDDTAADRIAGLGLVAVEMTLHAADAAGFEAVTRVPGSFDRFVRAVERLRARGVPLLLKAVLMRPNAEAAGAVAAFAEAAGARVRFAYELSPRNDGGSGPAALRMTDAQLEAYLRSDVPAAWEGLKKEPPSARRGKAICAAGTTTFAVNPYGDVLPCNQLLVPVGNLRERPFLSLWRDAPSPFLQKIRSVKTYGDLPGCADCELNYACRRCHGVAMLETGDFLAPSPSACALAALMARVSESVKAGQRD
jgi:radical SAM protein with 4Fe4S-binding SPASM domain